MDSLDYNIIHTYKSFSLKAPLHYYEGRDHTLIGPYTMHLCLKDQMASASSGVGERKGHDCTLTVNEAIVDIGLYAWLYIIGAEGINFVVPMLCSWLQCIIILA